MGHLQAGWRPMTYAEFFMAKFAWGVGSSVMSIAKPSLDNTPSGVPGSSMYRTALMRASTSSKDRSSLCELERKSLYSSAVMYFLSLAYFSKTSVTFGRANSDHMYKASKPSRSKDSPLAPPNRRICSAGSHGHLVFTCDCPGFALGTDAGAFSASALMRRLVSDITALTTLPVVAPTARTASIPAPTPMTSKKPAMGDPSSSPAWRVRKKYSTSDFATVPVDCPCVMASQA
mmetsp:Transcript_92228/g.246587  ORF Transcript_92228/g.246587 Transcript_92228/m.246587 type:complete len:232 (+) Transcript_92228:2176-2871(+)